VVGHAAEEGSLVVAVDELGGLIVEEAAGVDGVDADAAWVNCIMPPLWT